MSIEDDRPNIASELIGLGWIKFSKFYELFDSSSFGNVGFGKSLSLRANLRPRSAMVSASNISVIRAQARFIATTLGARPSTNALTYSAHTLSASRFSRS